MTNKSCDSEFEMNFEQFRTSSSFINCHTSRYYGIFFFIDSIYFTYFFFSYQLRV